MDATSAMCLTPIYGPSSRVRTVSIRSELQRLEIPDGTTVEEHDLVTEGDVFVGGQSTVEFGVRGRTIVGGERVRFGGDLEAAGDCRLDMWCAVDGNVLVGRDAYLGERVHIAGQLMVSGDLDIGDDVEVEEGLEANGWIVIRNPMPTIVFLFMYLTQLLRLGEEEEAARVLSAVTDEEGEEDPLIIPRGARVGDDAWRVSTPATVGEDCRLNGNLRAATIDVGAETEVFGSLRARGDIQVGPGAIVHGDVTTRGGAVTVAPDATVRGDVSCADLELHDDSEVDGTIRAAGEMVIRRDESETGTTDADAAASETGTAGSGGADDGDSPAETTGDAEPGEDTDDVATDADPPDAALTGAESQD